MPRTNARRNHARRLSPVAFFGLLCLLTLTAGFLDFALPAARAAAVFTVNSTGDGADADPADNLCADASGNCTLRAAVEQANATAGADTIGFNVTGTINLTGELPAITDSLTISGPGASQLTVRRDTGGDYRIFTVESPLGVNISGLTVANGRTPDGFAHAFGGGAAAGGGILNGGTMTLTDVTLTGNRTGVGGSIGANTSFGGPGGNGGAVLNYGTMTMTNVTLIGNSTGAGGEAFTAGAGGSGGAVDNLGTLTMNGCVVKGNATGGGGRSNREGGRGGDGGGVHSDDEGGGGREAFESPDAKLVYYAKENVPGLWRVPAEGGEEVKVLDRVRQGAWAVWERGVYFVNPDARPFPSIEFYDFATERTTRIATIEKDLFWSGPNLAATSDGRWILYVHTDETESDIMLIENFS